MDEQKYKVQVPAANGIRFGWKLKSQYCGCPTVLVVKSLLVATSLILLTIFWKLPLLTYSQCMQQHFPSKAEEYSYTVIRHTDIDGEDLMHIQARDLQFVKKVCDLFESCAGFNSNGWLKTKVTSHVPGPADLYIKSETQSSPTANVPVYHPGSSSSDYNEMLSNLKIYIYETNVGLKHRTVRSGGYGVESAIMEQLLRSHLRTRKPEEATFYFLPIRCSSYILGAPLEQEGIRASRKYIGDIVAQISTVYPYWDRSGGADHFYVCAHDVGAAIGADLLKNAIALVNTADYEDPHFIPHKDISMPPSPLHGPNSLPVIGSGGTNVDPRSRTILAFFAGDLTSGRIRPTVQKYFLTDPSFTIISREVSWSAYVKYLRQSKYCLILRGREVWSPRLMESVFSGCVPVILSDHYHLPLQGIVDWNEFSVIIPESQVLELKNILLSISDSKLAVMQQRLADVYSHFVWNNPARPHDAFYSVMYQLWQHRSVVRYRRHR